MGYLDSLSKTIDAAQLLKELHQYIEIHRLPVTSRDALPAQLIELEKYLGGSNYQQLVKKKNSINIWTGILALPVLLFGIFLLASRFAGYWGLDFDVSAISQTLFLGAIRYVWAIALYAATLIILVFYFKKLNTQAEAEKDNLIQHLKSTTSRIKA